MRFGDSAVMTDPNESFIEAEVFSVVPDGAALYLHVPFCEVLCDFCAFAKAKPAPGDWALFREGLRAEWEGVRFEGSASSAFWGGGTPGLLKASDIRWIGERFRERLRPGAEWTVELTPRCVTGQKLRAWREVGVNRISLGVQSFSPRLLQAMGRPYATDRLPELVDSIRRSGFERLNLDLIIAFPGQTESELEADIRRAVELEPDHVSAYCLTLEEDTPLFLKLAKERKAGAAAGDPDSEARLYERAWSLLEDAGYRQYEVSNFARPGAECLHHRNVWQMGEWRGFGPSAASQIGGVRFRNPDSPAEWHEGVCSAPGNRFREVSVQTPEERSLDRLAFGLRMNEGVADSSLPGTGNGAARKVCSFLGSLESEGLLETRGGRKRLTLAGRLVADEIARRILESAAP